MTLSRGELLRKIWECEVRMQPPLRARTIAVVAAGIPGVLMMTSQLYGSIASRYLVPRFRVSAGSALIRRATSSGNSAIVRLSAIDNGLAGHVLRRNAYVAWPSVPNPRITT